MSLENKMTIKAISLRDANAFVERHHRHHKKTQGHKFSIASVVNDEIVGIAIVGRPVARMLDDGSTIEVLRLCTNGYKNACSFLYSACARAGKALGYKKIITYILEGENGASLKASNWVLAEKECGGGSWSRELRPRSDFLFPQCAKQRWEYNL